MPSDIDVSETVTELLGFVAGDYFEGWPDYWPDETIMEERIIELLREWERMCRARKKEPTDAE